MQEERDYSSHALFRGIILLGFFLLLFRLLVSGNITFYIAPKMVPFSYFALVILLVLGLMQLWRSGSKNSEELYCNCGFSHSQTGSPLQTFIIYFIFILPVLTGLWFPETVLDSSIVAKRGIVYGSVLHSPPSFVNDDEKGTSFDLTDPLVDTAEIEANISEEFIDNTESDEDIYYEDDYSQDYLDELKDELLASKKIIVSEERYLDITNSIYAYLDSFIGKEIEIVGFVYKDPELEENQFVIARFGITCCVADASVYGILSTMDEMFEVEEDEWVRATGYLSKINLDDWDYPHLQITEIEKVEEPENPYIN
ncbi:TIGR03943 family putative permease subunit [Sporosarcina sp. YIM B06819]|uniref:TIGR03943 family putative permease subunit n=1 Tax=Sporosarcina sp. YIM B06819 TaxID=3081769 RepID=UPI00298C6CC6|nr:TIGR03943 family protein [Sporosarcina sp. YIM B06819]